MIALLEAHDASSPVALGNLGVRTAGELLQDVGIVIAYLPEPVPGKELLLVCADRYHFAVCLLAAWGVGHAVALPPNSQSELLREMAASDSVQLMLHDADEDIGIDVRALLEHRDDVLPGGLSANTPGPAAFAADQHLATVWTSGSTGEHQRHPKTAQQLLGEARTLAAHFGIGPGTRVLATVPPHHIYGLLFSILVPLIGGAAFVREQYLHAGAIAGAVERWGARVLVSVPAHLRALRILEDERLRAVDRVFSSGAPLASDTAQMLEERFGLVVTEILGSTETGGIAWRRGQEGEAALWQPLPGVVVSADGEGRLLVDSDFLPRAHPRPFATSDAIAFDARGGFSHLGRIDGVVKVAGKRIAIAEVERRILEIEGVEDAAVAAVEIGGARGNELVAAVVAPGLTLEGVRAQLRRFIDPVVVPRRLRFVDALPRDANGKIARRRVVEIVEETPSSGPRSLECTPTGESGPGSVSFAVRVPRNLAGLRGHFVGFPVVPGVVQLELAGHRAREHWPMLGAVARVLRLKFKRPMRPGTRSLLHLRREGSGKLPQVSFEFSDDEGEFSVGSLEFRLERGASGAARSSGEGRS